VFIPLDYYRILGLPLQATSEQLQQAHRDRTLQLPRQEYSDIAINARSSLLDKAYATLSNVSDRRTYDEVFLARAYEVEPDNEAASSSVALAPNSRADSVTPSIEIDDHQFVGALLLLQELGEYELVLRLGRPFLTGGSASLSDGQYGDPALVYPDIVLTVALACLELGREQWQQGQYENAAEALDTGQRLLLREGLFAGVRGEIQSDLFKLRPYRILELLSQSETDVERRYQGLRLLQEMLQERGGIDGSGNDHSGLSIDDFLRFIQQLRSYMTAAEQQVLFEQEASRPSAVATYLAVYALLARGFAEHQPALIRRSHNLLQSLSSRQDVYLEQAVCHLLLGQPEMASHSLEFSQEHEQIAFIRSHSQGAPDLLPGLCLYAERWLQDEVFPHFADLSKQPASLKDYFADLRVQEYLENLGTNPELVDEPVATPPKAVAASAPMPVVEPTSDRAAHPEVEGFSTQTREDADALIAAARARIAAGANASNYANAPSRRPSASVSTAERVPSGGGRSGDAGAGRGDRPVPSAGGATATMSRSEGDLGRVVRRLNRGKRSERMRWIFPVGLVLTFLAAGFLGTWLIRTWASSLRSESRRPQPEQVVQPSPSVSPSPAPTPAATVKMLDKASGEQIIESWLAAKAAAMGPQHETDKLEEVLTGKKLTEWERLSKEAKAGNLHRTYTHKVTVTDVKQKDENADRASVLAEVQEGTTYFESGKQGRTTNSTLKVRYNLVRKDGKWAIQSWSIL